MSSCTGSCTVLGVSSPVQSLATLRRYCAVLSRPCDPLVASDAEDDDGASSIAEVDSRSRLRLLLSPLRSSQAPEERVDEATETSERAGEGGARRKFSIRSTSRF